MQILIDIPDTLPLEEIHQLIARIESQLQTETYSIKLESKPNLETDTPAIAEYKRSRLVEYARQASLDVRSGKLKAQSVAEIMSQLDESEIFE